MQSLEAACEEGEASTLSSCQCDQKNSAVNLKMNMVCTHSRSFKKAKTARTTSLPLQPSQDSVPTSNIPPPKPQFCIHTKLLELHLEECANDPNALKTGLKRNSHLLEKLVARERLNTLVLNLYPGNKGYSLSFPIGPNIQLSAEMCSGEPDTADTIQTKLWPYEDEELLRYIDNEELPVFFIDLLLPNYGFLFYNGCIIAEVRDYRQAYPACKCDIHHVLLKPTLQSIYADINEITDDKVEWGAEEKLQLESQILLARNPQLCLDPKSTIAYAATKFNHNKQLLNTKPLRRAAKRYSQVVVNRKKRLVPHTHRPGLELYDFLTRTRGRLKPPKARKLLQHEEIRPAPVPSLELPPLNPPTQGVHIPADRLAMEQKPFDENNVVSDCSPRLDEVFTIEQDNYTKEKDKQIRRIYVIKISILQRPSNEEYLGELYVDPDYKEGERNGVACTFPLGTRVHVERYLQQILEIITEGGRKIVRVHYVKMGNQQNSHVCCTAYPWESIRGLPIPFYSPTLNGTVNSVSMLHQQHHQQQQQQQHHHPQQQQQQPHQSTHHHVTMQNSSVPLLQAQLQSNNAQVKTAAQTQNEEINALATILMNSSQQFQAAAAKQQQAKLAAAQAAAAAAAANNSNNAAIINLLNSSPASSVNSEASAVVVNAINNMLPQHVQTINQKLLGRKITLSNVPNARVINHGNLIAVNNNSRVSLSELNALQQQQSSQQLQQQQQQPQTITLTTANNANFAHAIYSTVPVKQQQQVGGGRIIGDGGKSALSALLVGTPAADRPDIIGPNTNSLLLEKLAGASASPNHAQSPPQFISGLQNVQVQLPGFSQPISLSLNVSSTGNMAGHHPTSLLVSVPVTTSTSTLTTASQQPQPNNVASACSSLTPTVVFGSGNIAQLVSSGVKGLTQQGIRSVSASGGGASVGSSAATGVAIAQGAQSFQIKAAPVQRPRVQQQAAAGGGGVVQQNIAAARTIQRTPITIKMAAAPQPTQFTDLQLHFDRT